MQENSENSYLFFSQTGHKIEQPANGNQECLIHAFVRTSNFKQLEMLLEVSPDCINEQNAFKETAVQFAIKEGYWDPLPILLKYKPNLSLLDSFGLSPLHISACFNNTELLQQLLDAKADINVKSNSKATPLISACSKNHYVAAQFLLEKGADVNATNDEHKSALHFAIENKNIDLATLLLSWGANFPKAEDKLEIDEKTRALLLHFQKIRAEKISAVGLLKMYNNGNFPSLKQLTGLFISTSDLSTKTASLPTDLQNFVAQYQPKKLNFKPWTNFYNFATKFFAQNEANSKLHAHTSELQNLISKTNCTHTEDIISHSLNNLEIIFADETDATQKIARVQKIYTDTDEKLKPHLNDSCSPK